MKKKSSTVPLPVLRRMPAYLFFVKTLQKQGEKYVSSTKIAAYMGIDATQVTKDMSHTGLSGKTRIGYEVEDFVNTLDDFLGFNRKKPAFLIGVGSLGKALLRDEGLLNFGLQIVKAFDIDRTKVGQKIDGTEIMHLNDFREMAQESDIKIGIITVPAENAQSVADLMVAWGIRAIWNFAPARLKVPDDVIVENTMIYTNLAVLFNQLKG